MFSSKSIIVSSLTFRCLIHSDFMFVHDIRECSNFILLHVAVQPLGRITWSFLKRTKNTTTMWPTNPATGHIPGQNHNLKRNMHSNVHCSSMYNKRGCQGRRRGWDELEDWDWCMRTIDTIENLLYSKGNSTQCSVVT